MARRPRPHRAVSRDDEAAVVARLSAFLAAEKTLSSLPAWQPDDRNLRLAATFEIDGVTEPGMLLRGRASLSLPDRNVTLALAWNDPVGRGGVFDRLDWRPVHAHNNRGLGPVDGRFAVIEGTHGHPLGENAALRTGLLRAIRENLPVALPVEPEPEDWAAFLALAEARWNVHGLVNTPPPPWQYSLPAAT